MEADWEVEVGGDAPIIDAHWPGFIDLRVAPARVSELEETRQLPGLAEALVRLNAMHSPFWTCKTDVFVPGPIDVDELDARGEDSSQLIACYVDLLQRGNHRWGSVSKAEAVCKEVCERLRAAVLPRCRADLIIRRANVEPGLSELGTTAYLTACGATENSALSRLSDCLSLLAGLLVPESQ